MLVVKHNPCHWFAMIVAFEDAEWSIWPDASVIAMTVVRRRYSATWMLYWTHRFPNRWGIAIHLHLTSLKGISSMKLH